MFCKLFVAFSVFTISDAVVPASSGTFTTNFLFTSTGATDDGNYKWNLVDSVGNLTIRGKEYVGLAFYTQLWPQELRWIDVVGVAKDGSNMCIIYFDYQYWNNVIVNPFWEEDLDRELATSEISRNGIQGTFVDKSPNNALIPISFPSWSNLKPSKQQTSTIVIDSSKQNNDIYFNDNIGWHLYNGINYTIYAYSFVDCEGCPKNCPECPPSPWYEIHHSAVSQDETIAGFGIYYIYPYQNNYVQWNYTFFLPNITSPNYTFQADWTDGLAVAALYG